MVNPSMNLRCAECRHTAPAIDFLMRGRKCAHCDSSIQVDPDNDLILVGHGDGQSQGVWIRLNWQEFRILVIWARFWADSQTQKDPEQSWMLRVADAISHQLKKLAPNWPLTLADDAEVAKRQNPESQIVARRPDGTEVQLEPTWLNSEITRTEPGIKDETPKKPQTGTGLEP